MKPSHEPNALEIKILIGILTVSVLARIAASFYVGNGIYELPGVSDQISYHSLALRLIRGHGLTFPVNWWPATHAGEPTAHWSFLYTFFVGAVYGLFGEAPLTVRLIQSVIVGILQPLLVYAITKRVFNTPAALIAAALDAVYFYFVYYSATLMTESFYITAVLATLYFGLRLSHPDAAEDPRRQWRWWLGLGLSSAAAGLLRQVFLLFLPVLFLWILYARRKQNFMRAFWQLFAAGLILLACIFPFTLYNYARFHQFVLLNTNSGFAFYWGNHPIYGTHFQAIISPQTGNYLELLPVELKDLNEAQLDSALLQRGVQFIVDDPGRYVLLSLSRIPIYFTFWPTPDSSVLSNLARVGSYGLVLPFMLYGAIKTMLARGVARLHLDSSASILLIFGLVYSLIHILMWTLVRYRLPVDAVFLSFAGYGIAGLAERLLLGRNLRPVHSEH